jgi:hypothetical protein
MFSSSSSTLNHWEPPLLHLLAPQTTCQPKYGEPAAGQVNRGPLAVPELQPLSPSKVETLPLAPDQ